MSTFATDSVWCLLVGPMRAIDADPFIVEPRHGTNIAQLKDLVKAARPNRLNLVDSAQLVVWRTKDPSTFMAGGDPRQEVPGLFEGNKLEKMSYKAVISDLKPKKDEILIIEYGCPGPELQSGIVFEPHLKPIPEEYRNMVLSAHRRGKFTANDLVLNQIIQEQDPPSSVLEFEKRLNHPRRINRDELINHLAEVEATFVKIDSPPSKNTVPSHPTNSAPSDSNNNPPPDPDSNNNPPPDSKASSLSEPPDITMSAPDMNPEVKDGEFTCSFAELRHLQNALATDFSTSSETLSLAMHHYSENFANATVFFPFAFGLRERPNFSFNLSQYSWPFNFFIQADQNLYSYRPKSDFTFAQGRLFRFIAEVQSQPSKEDKIRMLLQAACIVKFANKFLEKYKETRGFLLVTAYINKSGVVEQSIVYQDEQDGKVKYTNPQTFNLNARDDRLKFLRVLYNLVSWAAKDSKADIEDAQVKVRALTDSLNAVAKDFLAWTANPNRKEPEDGFAEQPPPPQRRKIESHGNDSAEQLEAEDYEV
ncbi:hypothetical protein EST38_g13872 [Candolleomyces aberdarensis]|uniref:Uncharacterized protein n=1 Tax=Candolleomyces aberdarensis TaxID=2316362 RepID=A0A4Q2CZX4_9AGAR|nr:hypothetical protein EST38_g13872 [Candolleomyces aberdarensis]